jgi:hypothetical protein
MGNITYRLTMFVGGFALFFLGLFYFGFHMKAGEAPYDMTELLGCVFAMLIGLMVVWGGILGSLEAGFAMWIPRRNSTGGGTSSSSETETSSNSEAEHMDEFEAERRGGQQCPKCDSYDTQFVEDFSSQTKFKCNRCGSYFMKDNY